MKATLAVIAGWTFLCAQAWAQPPARVDRQLYVDWTSQRTGYMQTADAKTDTVWFVPCKGEPEKMRRALLTQTSGKCNDTSPDGASVALTIISLKYVGNGKLGLTVTDASGPGSAKLLGQEFVFTPAQLRTATGGDFGLPSPKGETWAIKSREFSTNLQTAAQTP